MNHENMFRACTEVLSSTQQIEFVASYFGTTAGHAQWLLDAYQRYLDDCADESSTLNLTNRISSLVDDENQDMVSASL